MFYQKKPLWQKKRDLVSAFELWKQASLLFKNAENIDWCINKQCFVKLFLAKSKQKMIFIVVMHHISVSGMNNI